MSRAEFLSSTFLDWQDANQSKPPQGERVLLKLANEECPVVGYWGCGEWEICTVNLQYNVTREGYPLDIPVDYDVEIQPAFFQEDVLQYAQLNIE